MPDPRFDPDERFSIDSDGEDVVRRIMDGEGTEDTVETDPEDSELPDA
jgi:hypothetical protein